jgi:microcystin-dependent protein
MSNQFVAEVRVFPLNFAPTGWAFCNGQLMAISQNTALFSLLGTFYGGDGKATFGLPNLQGDVAIGSGQGPGLSLYDLGEKAGVPSVTLIISTMPSHNHNLMSENRPPDHGSPRLATLASGTAVTMYQTATTPLVGMDPASIAPVGGSLPHNNMMPYLTLNFCIALQGIYPPRT